LKEGRGKREEGRGKRDAGRGKREEGRGKREEGRLWRAGSVEYICQGTGTKEISLLVV
jgi:hypothetical protein